MRVKDNQPRLLTPWSCFAPSGSPVDRYETADRGRHGRQEHRRVEVFEVADRLPPEWRGTIACAARVSRLSWCKDTRAGLWQPRREVAYYVSQVPLDAAAFGRAVRSHWGIENRDHHGVSHIVAVSAGTGATIPEGDRPPFGLIFAAVSLHF